MRVLLSCLRCGWKWFPVKLRKHVKMCPKCKSLLWDTPRKLRHLVTEEVRA